MNPRICLRTCLSGFASLAFALSALAHSAVEPLPRPDEWWKQRHATMNSNVVTLGSKSQVIFIGDSITQGWEGEGKAVWAHYYTHRNAINLGIGGDRTQHVLWRLANGNLDGLHPKAAVVMIGTNNSNGEDNTPGQIVEGVRAIVDTLKSKLPGTKILLVAIFPRAENYSVQRGKLAQINAVLRRAADGRDVVWVDFGHQFINDDGTIPHDLMPDYLHLSPKGYSIWAEAIEDTLSQILGDTRVKPETASASPSSADKLNLSGEWVFTTPGPDGSPVKFPLVLEQKGSTLTGKFKRGEDRWLNLESVRLEGNTFSWKVKRDRQGGEVMEYEMAGTVENGALAGTVKTRMDGNEMTSKWTAARK